MRSDHTNYVVHWTKGTPEEALDALTSIAIDEAILADTYGVKSGEPCVCFSEAPVESFHRGGEYFQPFGIRVSKKWLFSQGGRPVIYQPSHEFQLLAEQLRWRHVDYDLVGKERRDYSWQREWRIKLDELYLPVSEVTLLVPDKKYFAILEQRFSNENYARGLASCDPYGYGMYMPHNPTQADQYRLEYFKSAIKT